MRPAIIQAGLYLPRDTNDGIRGRNGHTRSPGPWTAGWDTDIHGVLPYFHYPWTPGGCRYSWYRSGHTPGSHSADNDFYRNRLHVWNLRNLRSVCTVFPADFELVAEDREQDQEREVYLTVWPFDAHTHYLDPRHIALRQPGDRMAFPLEPLALYSLHEYRMDDCDFGGDGELDGFYPNLLVTFPPEQLIPEKGKMRDYG
jgi:hypothetical protein